MAGFYPENAAACQRLCSGERLHTLDDYQSLKWNSDVRRNCAMGKTLSFP